MLKERLIPTTLIDPSDRPPIRIVAVQENHKFRSAVLLLRLVRFGISIQLARYVRRLPATVIARRVREFFEEMGGLWIKAGQIISLRTDLLSPELVDELQQLQHHAFGFSPEISKQVVEESLGKPLTAVFDIFEELPFAAASISQVHRARLRYEQVWVAVKVQRPDIAEIFARDLQLLTWLTRLFGWLEAFSFIKWEGMIKELRRITQEEIDYRYEEANLRRIRKLMREHKVYVPKAFSKYSRQKVLVMEFIFGALMSDYLRLHRSEPERLTAWNAENNVDPFKVGSRLLRSVYRQMFEDNLFHGDLHPGNIMLLRDSRFALIDLGAIGNLESKFLNYYRLQTMAFAESDFSKAVDLFLLMADSIPVFDIPELKSRLVEMYRAWESRTHLRGLTYFEKSITGGMSKEMPEITRKYKVNPTWQFLRVSRALSTLDASLTVLLETGNPRKIMKQYFREAQRRSLRNLLTGQIFKNLGGTIADLSQMLRSTSDSMRMGEIKLQSVQTKAAYFFQMLFRGIRLGIVLLGVGVFYHFLVTHGPNRVAAVVQIDALRGPMAAVPNYHWLVDVVGLVFVTWLFWAGGKVKRRLAAETFRRPDGELDN